MSVLVFVDTENGAPKKSSQEAVAYGAEVAKHLGTETIAVVVDKAAGDLAALGKFGADKVLHAANVDNLQSDVLADLLVQAAEKSAANVIVMAKSALVDAAAPIIGVRMDAAIGSNVVALPDFSKGFVVRKGVFTGKALADVSLDRPNKVITLKKNAIVPVEGSKSASVEAFNANVAASKVQVKEVSKQTGEILLPEADIVVSAGRGMKGPENWGIVEDLAKALGAATACSKPVSDMDWRPHHEHVGQTGIKVSPNLYIALGISGAIQHLAGVNSSKVIVVVNKDAEAPFFKSADYGIVGDVFEVIPKLTEAIKKLA